MEKKRILIIDDEEGFTKLIKLNLELTGKFEVRVENKGGKGLEAAKEYKPHLILLDVIMPDLEGSEVAAQLMEEPTTKDIPVVFLTAIITKKEKKGECGLIGGHSFLAKPVSLKELVNCIEKNICS